MHWSVLFFLFFWNAQEALCCSNMKQKEGDTGHRQLGFLSGWTEPQEEELADPFPKKREDGDGCPSVRRGSQGKGWQLGI